MKQKLTVNKNLFIKTMVCGTVLSLSTLYSNPVWAETSSNQGVEREFTIEVSKDVQEKSEEKEKIDTTDGKEKEQKEKTIKPSTPTEEATTTLTEEQVRQLIESYQVENQQKNVPSLATPQSEARGTLTENVGSDNLPFSKDGALGKEGTSQEKDSSSQTEKRQFITFKTKSGKVFHLIINHDKSSENVQLLTEVSELDILNMIQTKTPKTKPVAEKQPIKEEVKKVEEPKAEKGGLGSYMFMGSIVLFVLGIGYYLKIYKPKQEQEFTFDEENLEDDDFLATSDESLEDDLNEE